MEITQNEEILSSLETLHLKIDKLIGEINESKVKAAQVEESCKKMDNHINSIEVIYGHLRSPLNYIVHKINYFSKEAEDDANLPIMGAPSETIMDRDNSNDSS